MDHHWREFYLVGPLKARAVPVLLRVVNYVADESVEHVLVEFG